MMLDLRARDDLLYISLWTVYEFGLHIFEC